jgi:uncharacterized protein (DUF1697 family)
MAVHIALLRAVNVGGRGLRMPELKSMFEALGFSDVRTLLQSGNVVFEGGRRAGTALESFLEVETGKRLKFECDYIVRTPAQWAALVAANPFEAESRRDPAHVVAMPLKTAPGKRELAALEAAIAGREAVRLRGRDLYIHYADGIGRSKLTVPLIEKKLDTRGTCRNWNTTLKVLAMVQGRQAGESIREGDPA